MTSAIPGSRWPRSLRSNDPPLIAISWSWSAAMRGRYRARSSARMSGGGCGSAPRARGVLDVHVLHAADEVGAEHLGLGDEVHVGDPRQHLLEDDAQLYAGEVGAQAEVVAAATERDLLRWLARDVEAERVFEHRLVAVGRDVPHHDLVALGDLAPLELGRRGGRAAEVVHGRRPAQDLLDR